MVAVAIACEEPVTAPAGDETDGATEDDDDDRGTTGEVPGADDDTSGDGDLGPDVPAAGVCGDGVRSGDEECDGTDLGGATCEDLGAFAGELSCTATCTIQDCDCDWGEGSSCGPPGCGNEIVDPGEECDFPSDPDWIGPTCAEILGGDAYGDLLCTACMFNTSGCGTCGDGVIQGEYETCDGPPLDEDGEPLACAPGKAGPIVCDEACQIDDSGCVESCGDGVLNGGEECDASDFGEASCSDFVLGGQGELACTTSCEIDPASCVPAGGNALISEILVASAADPLENVGEWIELHNPTADAFELMGCELRGQAAFETFSIDSLVIPAGGYVTLGKGTEDELGFVPDYPLAEQVTFLNDGDVVRLECGGIEVDEVLYAAAAPWPAFTAGVAIAVAGPLVDDDANDDGSDWCAALSVYALEQRGTPGAPNDCP